MNAFAFLQYSKERYRQLGKRVSLFVFRELNIYAYIKYLLTKLLQMFYDSRADESGTAGDEDFFHVFIFYFGYMEVHI